ncbi:MAG: tape measure protein [Polyangiales bacterium]
MAETRWKLTLESSKASRNAKALARDLRELAAAVKELKDAAGGLDLAGLGGARGRRSGGGSGGSGRVSDDVRRAREEARRARDEARTADRVRRASERAQAQNARREAREAAARQRDGARAQRAQDRAGERRYRLGFADARQRARDFRAADRAAGRGARADERAAAARQRALRQEARERSAGLSAGLGGAASMLGAIVAATTAAAAAIAGIVAAVGDMVFRLSSAVLEMIAFREASIATLGMMSEGRTAQERQRIGEEEFRWARQFARETPLDVQDVIGLRTQAATAGFRGAGARDVVMAAADVGAANPANPMAAQRFTTAIGQIRSKGRLQTEEINQLTEAGVERDQIYAQIARSRGITGTAQQVNNRVADLIRRGQITGEQGTAAVLAAVRERSGGQLGGLARSGGSTLMGTLSNLRGAFADFVLGIERIEQLPGIVALKKTLNSIVDLLTGTGPTAVRLRTIFADIVDEAAQFAASIGGKDGVEGIVNRALDLFEEWYPVVRDVLSAFASSAWSAFAEEMTPMLEVFGAVGQDRDGAVRFARELGAGLARLFAFGVHVTAAFVAMASAIAMLVDRVLTLAEALASLPLDVGEWTAGGIGSLRQQFAGIGSEIPEGMREGVEANRGGLLDAIASLNADVVATTQTDLDIHSPSRVFRDLGAMVPAGMAAGVDSGAADVQRAVSSMVAPPALGALGGAGAGGGFNATFNVYTQPGTPDEIGEQIAEATWSKLMDRFESAAAMQGE